MAYDGRFGEVSSDCLGCHAGDYILADGRRPSVGQAQHGITCSVCHNVHGELTEPRIGCDSCHSEGAYHHQPERNAGHVPCPSEAQVDCVDCHMSLSVEIGGAFALHDHRAGFVPPSDTERFGTPSGCANGGCHEGVSPAALQAMFEAHYRARTDVAEASYSDYGVEKSESRVSP